MSLRHLRARYDVIHVHSVPHFEVFPAVVPRLMAARVILETHDIGVEFCATKFKASEGSMAFDPRLIKKLSAANSSSKTLGSLSGSQVTLGERNAS
jgi:hypothetical protein